MTRGYSEASLAVVAEKLAYLVADAGLTAIVEQEDVALGKLTRRRVRGLPAREDSFDEPRGVVLTIWC